MSSSILAFIFSRLARSARLWLSVAWPLLALTCTYAGFSSSPPPASFSSLPPAVVFPFFPLEARSAAWSALRLAAGGGGGGVGDGELEDAKAEKRAARSTRLGSDGKVGGGGADGGSRSSMAWDIGSPRSAVKEPPPPVVVVEEEEPAAEAGATARAWISPPVAGGGEGRRIGAAAMRRRRRRTWTEFWLPKWGGRGEGEAGGE